MSVTDGRTDGQTDVETDTGRRPVRAYALRRAVKTKSGNKIPAAHCQSHLLQPARVEWRAL